MPYGAFANTTKAYQYGIVQQINIHGKPFNFNWPSSEHAFHAQKLLHLMEKLPKHDPRQTVLEKTLRAIEVSKSATGQTFLPRDDFDPIINNMISQNPHLDFGHTKHGFDALCDANFHSKYNPSAGLKPDGITPYTLDFMRTVIRLKLQQHPQLKAIAMQMAREGIMPVEVSRYDYNWASGPDGHGLNMLGIVILEEANQLLLQQGESPAIPNPKQHYQDAQLINPSQFRHDNLIKSENSMHQPGTLPAIEQAKPAKQAKILVINGHGAKITGETVQISNHNAIITPGDAGESYVTSFDDMHRHLEEATIQGKIWPITDDKGTPLQWTQYQNQKVDDIQISPLQMGFQFKLLAKELLDQGLNHRWASLTTPAHSPVDRGALAVVNLSGELQILEGALLLDYLQAASTSSGKYNGYREVFFCDKELGKVKPLGDTKLSEINSAIALIDEFKASGTHTIVATCSPAHGQKVTNITVKTKDALQDIASAVKLNVPTTPAIPPYELGEGNKVTHIELKGGIYIVHAQNTAGQARSIQVHSDGSIKGFNGSAVIQGHVSKTMASQIQDIFEHFQLTLPKPVDSPKAPSPKTPTIPAYQLGDGNKVTHIELKGGVYIVHAQNTAGQARSIQVHSDGSIKGFNGSAVIQGHVSKTMASQIQDIFDHFQLTLPKPDVLEIDELPKPTSFIPSMQILSGFIAAVGITAVAVSLTLFSLGMIPAATATIMGGVGLASALTGLGLFKYSAPTSADNNKPDLVDDPLVSLLKS